MNHSPPKSLAPQPQLLGPAAAAIVELHGVVFDDSTWYRWLVHLLHRMELRISYASFFRLWEFDYFDRVLSGEQTFWEALRSLLHEAGLKPGAVDEVCAAGQSQMRRLNGDLRPLPGVLHCLASLNARGVPVILWANTPGVREQLGADLRRKGLHDFFQHVVSPEELLDTPGTVPRYRQFAMRLNLPPEQLVFVARDAKQLALARESGLLTATLNATPPASADAQLSCLADLNRLVTWLPAARRLAG